MVFAPRADVSFDTHLLRLSQLLAGQPLLDFVLLLLGQMALLRQCLEGDRRLSRRHCQLVGGTHSLPAENHHPDYSNQRPPKHASGDSLLIKQNGHGNDKNRYGCRHGLSHTGRNELHGPHEECNT